MSSSLTRALVLVGIIGLAFCGCASRQGPPVPFDVKFSGPLRPTPVFVLDDGYAYWWFETDRGGEIVFVNPATFEEFVLDSRTRSRVFIGLGGSRHAATAMNRRGGAPSATIGRGMTLEEVRGVFRSGAVEAPVGWVDLVRQTREKEFARESQLDADRERNRVAESVKGAEASGGSAAAAESGGPAVPGEAPIPPPVPAIPQSPVQVPLASPLFPAVGGGAMR